MQVSLPNDPPGQPKVPMTTVMFVTTQTSATASMQRIIRQIVRKKLTYMAWFSHIRTLPRPDMLAALPPEDGHLLFFNYPPVFNRSLDLSKYRFVVNFRDPRDRICNVYHWQLSHPQNDASEEARLSRIAEVKEMGINAWVERTCQSQSYVKYYDNIFWLLENAPAENCAVLTYARLCCDFDSYIGKLAHFLDEQLDVKRLAAMEQERVENLGDNIKWIGNKWSGSDTLPGRYRGELDAERIELVTSFYEPVLRKMAKFDPDFAEQYLEGLSG